MEREFEWDRAKADANRRKHGIGFEEAATVFLDPLALTLPDDEHSDTEDRSYTIGRSKHLRILLVVHCERTERIRIISARKATHVERQIYEESE